ncbi:MAG: helix-turn-helix transcriptional regulator [Anaerolineae bacterium]|nr:helix-turn-helix transcriptional regulator [Anaerolineae bacterium]
MSVPILATKLFIPPPPARVVIRPRLLERLNECLTRKLTLISAPAGFGKTTLVSAWCAAHGKDAAQKAQIVWLSLDEADSDLTRWLIYVIGALQTIAPETGQGVLDALQSLQPPPIESILTALLNDLTALPDDCILILDDYHALDSKSVDDALAFLIEHLPPQMQLVITTREDPQLPLPRLRARGQLNELRAADLRFTPSEAAEFLNAAMGLDLSAKEITALENRTEGWVAGLQLAALSMRGTDDIPGFIRAFAGDHQYIVDYLVAEVLQQQPQPIRSFLLETSILDRLSGSLCDAVTGQKEGDKKLQALEKGNLFVVPLDDKRHWYRYHHLFAQVLYAHLKAEQPNQIPILHRRASEWHEHQGLADMAIRHALAAGDFERAADLIERAVPEMRRTRQEPALLGWFKALPDEAFHNRPVLCVHYAGTLMQNGQFEGVESRLRDAERWLDMPADTRERPIIVDAEDFERLSGSVAMYHAGIALAKNDAANTIKYARQVLELAREDDSFLRGAASGLLGLAFWTGGDLETAYRLFADGMSWLHKSGFISDVIGGSVVLSDLRVAQGRLREAMSIYERGLELATQEGPPALRGAADMHVGLSELYRERNELDLAAQHLLKSKELGELNGMPKNPYRRRVVMARIKETLGDTEGALVLLDQAERLYVGDFAPDVRPVSALRARVWVAAKRLDQALTWARERGLSVDDELGYLREFEHITLARILLSLYQNAGPEKSLRDAIGLMERLAKAAKEGGRMGSLIEILALQALARQMQNDIPAALASLERALTLAGPEGYVRMFLDEGPPMARLLGEIAARGVLPEYTARLLSEFQGTQPTRAGESPLVTTHATQPLPEPLSERELQILRLFKTDLSGPEIAEQLVIALSTVRSHTKNIYSKLSVNNRRAAVQRAVELGLI